MNTAALLPIVLVACASMKRHGLLVAAAELYTSPLFTKSLAFARRITSDDRIFILSAKHAALALSELVAPYDLSIYDLTTEERERWAARVGATLRARFGDELGRGELAPLVVLAGGEYVRALDLAPLAARLPWYPRQPLGGMSIGLRLRWLNEQARRDVDVEALDWPRPSATPASPATPAAQHAPRPRRAQFGLDFGRYYCASCGGPCLFYHGPPKVRPIAPGRRPSVKGGAS